VAKNGDAGTGGDGESAASAPSEDVLPGSGGAPLGGEPEPERPESVWERRGYDAVAVITGVWIAILSTVAAVFFAPFRAGTTLVPLSLLFLVVGSIASVQYIWRMTGTRFLVMFPSVAWFLTIAFMGPERAEGDLLLARSNWVSTAIVLVGTAVNTMAVLFIFSPRVYAAGRRAAGASGLGGPGDATSGGR
jgi:hypothetical protein